MLNIDSPFSLVSASGQSASRRLDTASSPRCENDDLPAEMSSSRASSLCNYRSAQSAQVAENESTMPMPRLPRTRKVARPTFQRPSNVACLPLKCTCSAVPSLPVDGAFPHPPSCQWQLPRRCSVAWGQARRGRQGWEGGPSAGAGGTARRRDRHGESLILSAH